MAATAYSAERRFSRHSVELSVVCGDDVQRLADRVVNMSIGGACIQTPQPLKPGSVHHFVFTVPDARFRDTTVAVAGSVSWAVGNTMGVAFVGRCAGIDDYVRRLERAFESY